MSWASDAQALLERYAKRVQLPRVRALHLPPIPEPGGTRGEFCALELDDGALGLSFVLLGNTLEALREGYKPLAGIDALELVRGFDNPDPLRHTLGFAAINALTRSLFNRAGFVPGVSRDSTGGLDPQPGETIGMIGYFPPLVERIVQRGARIIAVELRADLVRDDGTVRITLDPRELAPCRQVLATGSLLLNDTLDGMRAHCASAQRFVLIGPSVGAPPDPLFARGITALGGSWIENGPAYCDALRRAEPTSAFARKYALMPRDYPGWDALLRRL